jgi:hypothetical protein
MAKLTDFQILEIDAKRNSQGVDAQKLKELIEDGIKNKNVSLVREGDTLIAYLKVKDGHAEFHCFNADTAENLVKNVSNFYNVLRKEGFKTAETDYDNPKINDLIIRTTSPKNVTIGKGVNHTYLAKVVL